MRTRNDPNDQVVSGSLIVWGRPGRLCSRLVPCAYERHGRLLCQSTLSAKTTTAVSPRFQTICIFPHAVQHHPCHLRGWDLALKQKSTRQCPMCHLLFSFSWEASRAAVLRPSVLLFIFLCTCLFYGLRSWTFEKYVYLVEIRRCLTIKINKTAARVDPRHVLATPIRGRSPNGKRLDDAH